MAQPPESEALAWVEARERRDPAFRARVEAELAAMRLEQEVLELVAKLRGVRVAELE